MCIRDSRQVERRVVGPVDVFQEDDRRALTLIPLPLGGVRGGSSVRGARNPLPNPLPAGEGTSGPLPNPLAWGEGTLLRSPALLRLFLATAITLLAAALRFLYLGHDSLWFDEVLTRQTAAAGFTAALAVRDHVPLLYWLTTAVLRLLPEHEVTLRLVSALAGVLAVPLMVALGRVVRLSGACLLYTSRCV